MIRGWARGTGTFGAIVLASVLLSNTASAGPHCDIRLAVELTPDVHLNVPLPVSCLPPAHPRG